MKHWWVVYKVNPEMDTRRYVAYVERHNDDDVVYVYREENGHQSLSFTVFYGVWLTKLDTHDVELIEEEPRPSKKCLRKSKRVTEKQERCEWLNACVTEADSDVDDFW
jgi:hypothetical protein